VPNRVLCIEEGDWKRLLALLDGMSTPRVQSAYGCVDDVLFATVEQAGSVTAKGQESLQYGGGGGR
jgi:hypothetical protein